LRINIKDELLPLALLVILLIATITLFPNSIIRIILGLPFLLFFPGYTLIAAISPRMRRMGSLERIALSFGLSLAVVPIIGLILNSTPWGIRLETILWSTASFIFVMAAIAWLRRRMLPEVERFNFKFTLSPAILGNDVQSKSLSFILILAVLGALVTMGYAIAKPNLDQTFTEFYILGLEDKTTDYPKELKIGQEGRLSTGIVNHEHETVSYQIEIRINSMKDSEIGPIVLEHEEKWEGEVSFVSLVAGEKQNVEFLLYKNEVFEPYLEALIFWFDVKRPLTWESITDND